MPRPENDPSKTDAELNSALDETLAEAIAVRSLTPVEQIRQAAPIVDPHEDLVESFGD